MFAIEKKLIVREKCGGSSEAPMEDRVNKVLALRDSVKCPRAKSKERLLIQQWKNAKLFIFFLFKEVEEKTLV